MVHMTNEFDVRPFLDALEYVVEEGRKHRLAGNEDHFVAVAKAANAALLWHAADRVGNYDEAQKYLELIPRRKK